MDDRLLPRIAVRSVGLGILLMAFFTLLWSGWLYQGLPLAASLPLGIAFDLAALFFVFWGVRLLVIARRFPVLTAEADKQRGKRMGIAFGVIFGIEGVLIGAASGILGGTGHLEFIGPAIALIVGLHFIPLARVFERTVDYYVAAWVVLVAVAGIVLIAADALPWELVSSLVALATACGTAFYGFYMIAVARGYLARLPR